MRVDETSREGTQDRLRFWLFSNQMRLGKRGTWLPPNARRQRPVRRDNELGENRQIRRDETAEFSFHGSPADDGHGRPEPVRRVYSLETVGSKNGRAVLFPETEPTTTETRSVRGTDYELQHSAKSSA